VSNGRKSFIRIRGSFGGIGTACYQVEKCIGVYTAEANGRIDKTRELK